MRMNFGGTVYDTDGADMIAEADTPDAHEVLYRKSNGAYFLVLNQSELVPMQSARARTWIAQWAPQLSASRETPKTMTLHKEIHLSQRTRLDVPMSRELRDAGYEAGDLVRVTVEYEPREGGV